MRVILSVILGLLPFYLFVFKPAKANFIATLTKYSPIGERSKINLLGVAVATDTCNPDMLEQMGDGAVKISQWQQAIALYNASIGCAPNRAHVWFKMGVTKLYNKQNGLPEIVHSLELEPNNVMFRAEYENITKILQKSQ